MAIAIAIAAIAFCSRLTVRPGFAEPATQQAVAADERVWLCNLPEKDVKVGWGEFGKNGHAGFEDVPIELNQIPSPHGLGMHPDSSVTYELAKKFYSFRAAVAVNDSAPSGAARPIRFQVLADGKEIWKSNAVRVRDDCQPLLLDITGVDRLTLKTFFDPEEEGSPKLAHAVWLEPFVSSSGPDPELVKLLAVKNFTQGQEAFRYIQKIKALMTDDKFVKLEELAKAARADHSFFHGITRLRWFYETVEIPEKAKEADYLSHLAWLERWSKQFPDSPTPRIAAAYSWIQLAFAARGGGYAGTVSDEGWKLFHERIAKAAEMLAEAEKMEPKDPELYAQWVNVAQYEGWPREKTDELVSKSLKIDPNYYPTYRAMVQYLLPRWNGERGDEQTFANAIREKIGGVEGQLAYANVVLEYSLFENWDGVIAEFNYKQVEPAMVEWIHRTSYQKPLIHRACILACQNADFKTAKSLFELIPPGDCEQTVWGSGAFLESWRRRALDPKAIRGEETKTLQPKSYFPIYSLSLSSNGKRAFTGEGPYLCLRDLESGTELYFNMRGPMHGVVADLQDVRILSDVRWYGIQSHLALFDISQPKIRVIPAKLDVHKDLVTCSAFSHDGRQLATGGMDKNVFLWKVDDLSHPQALSHPSGVSSVAFSPDGETLATSSIDGGVWIWDAKTAQIKGSALIAAPLGPKKAHLLYTTDGKSLVVAGSNGALELWDLPTRKRMHSARDGAPIMAVAASPNGNWLAIGRENADIDLFAIDNLAPVHTFHGHWSSVSALAFLPDNKTLISGSWDGTLKFWDSGLFAGNSTTSSNKPVAARDSK